MQKFLITLFILAIAAAPFAVRTALAQDKEEYTTAGELSEESFENPIPEPPPLPGEEKLLPPLEGMPFPGEPQNGEQTENPVAENRYGITITGAVQMNYVFNDSPDSFTVKYVFEVKGRANAAVAVLKGEAKITPTVSGALSKWPTGECKLEVSVSTIPYELTFKKTDEKRASLKLIFKKSASEDWESKCSFADAPNKKFNTRGTPELWFMKAIEKSKPSLKDMSVDINSEETSTSFAIAKEIISDPPVGSGEIEGRGVVTITPGG